MNLEDAKLIEDLVRIHPKPPSPGLLCIYCNSKDTIFSTHFSAWLCMDCGSRFQYNEILEAE